MTECVINLALLLAALAKRVCAGVNISFAMKILSISVYLDART